MATGGARVGAGRKPKTAHGFEVIEGQFRPESEPAEVPMPDDLGPGQAEVWGRLAGLAVERRTLTAATVPAFRLLCELEVERGRVREILDRDGRTYLKVTVDGAGQEQQELKAHPLKGDYRTLSKQVETLLARFLLAPFGKPVAVAKQATSADERFFGATGAGR